MVLVGGQGIHNPSSLHVFLVEKQNLILLEALKMWSRCGADVEQNQTGDTI